MTQKLQEQDLLLDAARANIMEELQSVQKEKAQLQRELWVKILLISSRCPVLSSFSSPLCILFLGSPQASSQVFSISY